jgi:hypothetical protein
MGKISNLTKSKSANHNTMEIKKNQKNAIHFQVVPTKMNNVTVEEQKSHIDLFLNFKEQLGNIFSHLFISSLNFLMPISNSITKPIREIGFAEAVSYFADKKTNNVITNVNAIHATLTMNNIFRTAEKYVYIVAKDLNGSVSTKEYVGWLMDFLNKKDTILKIILEHNIDSSSSSIAIPEIKAYKEKYQISNDRITLGYAKNISDLEFSEDELSFFDIKEKNKSSIKHYAIADDRMYRLEIDTKEYIAIANFNDKDKVQKLKEKFSRIEPNFL